MTLKLTPKSGEILEMRSSSKSVIVSYVVLYWIFVSISKCATANTFWMSVIKKHQQLYFYQFSSLVSSTNNKEAKEMSRKDKKKCFGNQEMVPVTWISCLKEKQQK